MKFIDKHDDAWLLLPDSEIAGPTPHRLLTLTQWEAVRDRVGRNQVENPRQNLPLDPLEFGFRGLNQTRSP